jgi:hypothetical protein
VNGYGQAPVARRTNPLAIAALVCGIAGFCAAPPAAIAAIILGHISLGQIRRDGDEGYGLAKAGLILGYVALVLGILGLVLVLSLAVHIMNSNGTTP